MHPTSRLGVGIVPINRSGKVLIVRHINGWQMPQGKINRGESPADAVLRELREEISTDAVEILAEGQGWRPVTEASTANDGLPADPRQIQRQKWFLVFFRRQDVGISLVSALPGFDAWQWVPPEELTALVAPINRQLYLEIIEEFAGPIADAMRLISDSMASETAGDGPAVRSGTDVPCELPEEVKVDDGPLAITDGEVNFIQGFLHDGSIGAECGLQLMHHWGYCERHAWVSLAVEMSALHGFCSRSATLYADILRQGIDALEPARRRSRHAVAKALKESGDCMICKANPSRRGLLSVSELITAKDIVPLRRFAGESVRFWGSDCCPRCINGLASGSLCRRHLVEAINAGILLDLEQERERLLGVLARLENYAWSFSWGFQGIDGPEDRAALISTIGWCSGWSSLAAAFPLGRPFIAPHLRSVG